VQQLLRAMRRGPWLGDDGFVDVLEWHCF
jgi:hypothetical protein